jgi:outer membrane biogenesis lipoprotein LolB
MSLRSIAGFTALVLQLLQLCACTASKPSNAAVEEIERRHDEQMQRMGGGSGGSM